MAFSKQAIIIAFILSVVLFVVGFYTWNSFFLLILPVVNDVNYFETDLSIPFWNSLVFGLTLALIPVVAMLTWKFAPIITTRRKSLTVCVIVFAMMVSILIRREVIKSQLRNLKPSTVIDYSDPANTVQKEIQSGLPLSDLKFEYFALVGVIAGSTISLFALKEKAK